MKNKKGFTLIELLAVIVILAIIALIAVPVVLRIVEKAKEGAAVNSAYAYVKSVETYMIRKELIKDETTIEKEENEDGSFTYNVDDLNDKVSLKGRKPASGTITLSKKNKVIDADMSILGYFVVCDEKICSIDGKDTEKRVESIKLSQNNAEIKVGKTVQLEVTVKPDDAPDKSVTWTSSDSKIATVDDNGLVTGVSGGTAKITVTAVNGKKATATVKVTVPTPVSFAEDDWETIIANVKVGNTSVYKVGDEKEVTLTSTDSSVAGTYKVRLANNSNYNCTLSSKTACGFVVEFVNIIAHYRMNTSDTNAGGWGEKAMHKYVNDTIYNALPSDLKEGIITTTVVSGHGNGVSSNYTTEDKLYLLATAEVWSGGSTSDTAKDATITRQLDYYANKKVTTSSYAAAKKYTVGSTSASNWWLRSAISSNDTYFFMVNTSGSSAYDVPHSTNGVSPAFRIG